MLRSIGVLAGIFLVLLSSGCLDDRTEVSSLPSQVIGSVKLYTFTPDEKYFLGSAEPFILPRETSITDTLTNLGQHLADNYFGKEYTSKLTRILFEVRGLTEISTSSRTLRIAVVNMLDPDRDAMGSFFQGSTGAHTTLCMIGATFMQPHLSPPLLDGLVVLYNGEILPQLDHINLEGILVPRTVEHAVQRAILRTTKEACTSNEDETV